MQKYITKKFITLVLITLFAGIGGFLLYSYSYVEINVQGAAAGQEILYTITNAGVKNANPIEFSTSSRDSKRMLRRGSYEVSVRQGETSYLSIVKSGGFLQTQKVNTALTPEKRREFIGNNPNICMYTDFGVLASSPCTATVDELGLHMPSNTTVSSYVRYAQGPAAILEDIITFKGAVYALLSIESENDDEGNYHALYSVDNNGVFNQSSEQRLSGLLTSNSYKLALYEDGFIAYSPGERSDILYYTTLNSEPTKLNIDQPNDPSLVLMGLHVVDNQLTATYSNQPLNIADRDNTEGIKSHSDEFEKNLSDVSPKTMIVNFSNNKSVSATFNKRVVSSKSCGNNKLCVLFNDTSLGVYEFKDSESDVVFEVSGVLDFYSSINQILIVKNEGVYSFDISSQSGFMAYSFGDIYSYCGIKQTDTYFVVCVADKNQARFALKVHSSNENSDSIDKKIASLSMLEEVTAVVVYGSFIYIAPYVGELQPLPNSGAFGYSPEKIKTATNRINNELDLLGINKNTYSVVFTAE